MIPGLRSLCSHKHPTRDARAGTPLPGLNSVAATRLVDADILIDSLLRLARSLRASTQQIIGRERRECLSQSRCIGSAAKVALIRAAASTRTLDSLKGRRVFKPLPSFAFSV